MKKINKISIKKLEGQKMSTQELKSIVGGSNYTSCCGSYCSSVVDGSGTWIGCQYSGMNVHCCYG